MAWQFGDGFDLYAAAVDATGSYWDASSGANIAIVTGRFAGSRAFSWTSTAAQTLIKTSSINDAAHHFVVGFQQTAAISGSSLATYIELFDGVTAQCSVVFRSDGAILLVSGAPNSGTTLATYTGAFPLQNTWYAFEIEVVINNTTGSFAIRKNGNTSNDFFLGSLNTRPTSTNNYANKIQIAQNTGVNSQQFDDFFWRSDASSVPWMGDIRCYTRMPASDQSVQFTRAPTTVPVTATSSSVSQAVPANTARYSPFTALVSGSIGSATIQINGASTANFKCALYSSSGGLPVTVLASATAPLSAPGVGTFTFTFSPSVAVVAGTAYFVAFDQDAGSGTYQLGGATSGYSATVTYASFPTSSPTVATAAGVYSILQIAPSPSANYTAVNEAQQDATTSYVYDSTAGHADFYGISSIAASTPITIAVVTRAYMQKSDAGTRTAAVQLKSGASTVASPTLTLTTSGWLWTYRIDTVDPATGAAWSPTAVAAATIGPVTVA